MQYKDYFLSLHQICTLPLKQDTYEKRFYSIGSLICAGLLAIFGFGSCKSGKALQAERARLTAQTDSLNSRVADLNFQIKDTQAKIEALRRGTHVAMYGGPNMTFEERRRMEEAARKREEAMQERIKVEEDKLKGLDSELYDTQSKLTQVQNRLGEISK